jgi:phospholipid/cholesterol/gamma-HCH transport system ATP-binding protein
MSETDPIVVSFRDVHKTFGGKKVLDGINLEVRRNEMLVVLGGSGTGKSVLLKHISGLLRPDSGGVVVLGWGVSHRAEEDLVELRTKVSYIFQQGALFDSLTVGENIAFPLREHTPLPEPEIDARVADLLTRVGLAGIENLEPSELSGGMRKRVALARGLALEPEVILYDEPTAGLDPLTGLAITHLIKEIDTTTTATSLVVTHDLAAARELGGRVAFLHEGQFAFMGTLDEAARVDGLVGSFVRAGGIHARD